MSHSSQSSYSLSSSPTRSYFARTVSSQSSAPTTPASSEYCAKPDPHDLIDQVPWQRVNEVLPGLFVGGLDAARSLRFLRDKRIGAVLSVCGEFVPAEDRTLELWHLRLAVPEAGGDLLVALPRAVAFIEQARAAGRAVLVHSARGQNRAPAVVAAYLMQARKLDAGAALQRVRTAHEPAWVSPALHEQLVLFRLCHFGPAPGVPVYDGWRAQMLAAGRH